MGWFGGSSGEGEGRCLGDLSFERERLIELGGGVLCIILITRFPYSLAADACILYFSYVCK